MPAATELRVAIRAVAQPMRTVSFAARSAPKSTVKSTLRPGTSTRVVMAVPRVAKVIDDDQPIEAVDRARRTTPGRESVERTRTLHRPQGAATTGGGESLPGKEEGAQRPSEAHGERLRNGQERIRRGVHGGAPK